MLQDTTLALDFSQNTVCLFVRYELCVYYKFQSNLKVVEKSL